LFWKWLDFLLLFGINHLVILNDKHWQVKKAIKIMTLEETAKYLKKEKLLFIKRQEKEKSLG